MMLLSLMKGFVKNVLWRRYLDDDGKPCSKVKRNPFRIRGNISGVKETLSAKCCRGDKY